MRDNPEGGELDPASDGRRRCKKSKRTREGCDRNSEVGSVHSGRDGDRSVPRRRNRKNLSEERVVRK